MDGHGSPTAPELGRAFPAITDEASGHRVVEPDPAGLEPLRLRATVLVVGLCALSGSASHAQLAPPPEIQVLPDPDYDRHVRAEVTFVDPPQQFTDGDDQSYAEEGPWSPTVKGSGPGGEAEAKQTGRVSTFSIVGKGSVYASAELYSAGGEEIEGDAEAETEFQVQFSVPVQADFTFSATFAFEGSALSNSTAFAAASVLGATDTAGCGTRYVFPENAPETWQVACTGTAEADAAILLTVLAQAGVHSAPFGDSRASFEFSLDFGDTDGDGLLDTWELNGMDLGGGLVLTLPEAKVDKKDIYVELDVMDGVTYSQEAIDRVIAAFEQAPPELVGSPGITLHVETDGDHPGAASFVTTTKPDGSIGLPQSYYDLKNAYFGSVSDRSNPRWPEIWDARLRVYRYALWANEIAVPDQDCTTGFNRLGGLAEGIPSNDFVVAAGWIQSLPSDPEVDWEEPGDVVSALAGTFMHELGHTLGLRHGGLTDTPNFKPNYLSVMNYAYAFPWPAKTDDGQHARIAQVLDFSDRARRTLDENALVETTGLDEPDLAILYSSAPDGASRGRVTLATSADQGVNWDHDFDEQQEPVLGPDPIALDISRFYVRRSSQCGGREIPVEYEVLESASDWDRLWYGLPGGLTADSSRWRWATSSQPGIDEDTLRAVLESRWVGETFSPLIFSDGFESGDSSKWQ